MPALPAKIQRSRSADQPGITGVSMGDYMESFLPLGQWQMPAPPVAHTDRQVMRQVTAADTKAAGGGAKPAPAGGEKTFNLGLYDYNKEHMIAWPDAQTSLMNQWKDFIAAGTGKGKWYNTLKAGGYLKKEYTAKLASQAEYLKYEATTKSLQKQIKKAKGKKKTELEEKLGEMEKVLPVEDVKSLVVDFAKDIQRNAFKGWAKQWGKGFGAQVHAVTDSKEAESKLEEEITAHSPAKLQHLALFGHGSGRSGWIHMGDVGKMLLKDTIKTGLATDLRLILYMCSAGASGEKSFAAKVAGKLKKAGFTGPQVWAHTDSGSAAYNPDWIVFKDKEAGGLFYKTIFDAGFVSSEEKRLEALYGSKDKLLNQAKSILHIKQPKSLEELMIKWYDSTGHRSATKKYIFDAPLKPKESAEKLRVEWTKFIDKELAKKATKKGK